MEKADEVSSLEFKWLKKRGVGVINKGTRFYESFIYDGVVYTLYDCVYMYSEGSSEPYIGKLVKIWEHSHKNNRAKKVKVHWFFRPEEISNWLGDAKTLKNEVFLASGEGPGLANICPLEAIAGQCNVVCVSKDCRNPQPSDEELKAADHIFYRAFDVQSCTILDKMDDKVGGLEIKYMFNRKEGEIVSTFSEGTSDTKEENKNTATCSEPQQLSTISPSNKLKYDGEDDKLTVKVDANGEPQATIEFGSGSGSGVNLNEVGETNSEMGKTDSSVVLDNKDNAKLKDMPFNKDKADKDVMEAGIVPVHEVKSKGKNKTSMGSDKLDDRPLKKIKSNGNTISEDKQIEVAQDSDTSKDMPSNKSKAESSIKSPVDGKLKREEKLSAHADSNLKQDPPLKKIKSNGNTTSKEKQVEVVQESDRLKDTPSNKSKAERSIKSPVDSKLKQNLPLKKIKSNGHTTPEDKQVEVARDSDALKDTLSNKSKVDNSMKSPVDSKLKHEEKLPLRVNNLKAVGTSGTTEENSDQKNGKVLGSDKGIISAKVTADSEGKILKKARADISIKVPDNKKDDSVQKLSINDNGSNGKDLVAASAFNERKRNSGLALDSLGTNKEPQMEQSDENKRNLSLVKSPKVSTLSTDEDKNITYQEFVVGPKPNADKIGWFRLLPWEQRLKEAYQLGAAILLHNVDPDYTSREVEDIIWHALTENCEAQILQRTAESSPHCVQALILLKTKEAAQRILTKLDEGCLMLSNGRPLVGTPCPPMSSKKNSKVFGHLTIDKIRLQNQRELDEAVSTSHISQPNIEYDMAMEWLLLYSRSNKWWKMMHKQQGDGLKKLEAVLKQK